MAKPGKPANIGIGCSAWGLGALYEHSGRLRGFGLDRSIAPIYGWFTEGFDTADLKEAKALLGQLV